MKNVLEKLHQKTEMRNNKNNCIKKVSQNLCRITEIKINKNNCKKQDVYRCRRQLQCRPTLTSKREPE